MKDENRLLRSSMKALNSHTSNCSQTMDTEESKCSLILDIFKNKYKKSIPKLKILILTTQHVSTEVSNVNQTLTKS